MMPLFASLLLMSAQAADVRQVTFSYLPPEPAKSVVVVGQFNEWDRAANPLVKQPDGKTWRGTFAIRPGVYQYLFCVDGSRWIPDPTAPPVPDANGNVNSKLVVNPPYFDPFPGKVGDGIVTAMAVRHHPTREDTARLDRDHAYVRLQTRADDIERAAVMVGGIAYPMRKVDTDGLFDLWQGNIQFSPSIRTSYSFALEDGGRLFMYGSNGGLSEQGAVPEFTQNLAAFPLPKTPDWVKDAVFYQIFPERFWNGDPHNDGPGVRPWSTIPTPKTWRLRVGGDLAGIRQKMSHLRDLGANALYLNPVFAARSNHAYDTDDYTKVDPRFGTNGELKALVADAHRTGIHVILDAVFNHSSPDFFAFRDVRSHGLKSPYKDWYFISGEPVEVKEGQKTYRTFAGVPTMPKLNQDNPATRNYFLGIGTRWIKQAGIDGWRLDVADEVSQEFWRRFRVAVKGAKKDAYILGEVWGDAHEYLQGDEHDAVMNYRWRKAVLDFLAYGNTDASGFDQALARIRDDYPPETLLTMFNLLGSHDTERIKTVLKGDAAKERLAVLFQFTYPGAPSVYYGDEIGMEGGKDPDQRRPMIWEKSKWDMGLLQFYKDAIRLRREHVAFRRGAYRTLVARDGLFGFERTKGAQRIRVFLNNSRSEVSIPAGKVLMQHGFENGRLGPWGYAVLAG